MKLVMCLLVNSSSPVLTITLIMKPSPQDLGISGIYSFNLPSIPEEQQKKLQDSVSKPDSEQKLVLMH